MSLWEDREVSINNPGLCLFVVVVVVVALAALEFELRACKAGTLPLKPLSSPLFVGYFWRCGSHFMHWQIWATSSYVCFPL
jgi:hypothetical protein